MFAHITEPPPAVTKVRPELPEALDAVIARAMAKAPDERFATCREMIEAARAALGGASAGGRRAAPALLEDAPPAAAAVRRTCRVLATPLVGRDAELAEVVALLRAARRAPRHADRARRHRQDAPRARGRDDAAGRATTETYFVDLAPVQDPTLVGSAIADVLGVREAPNRPLADDDRRAARRPADADRARQLRAGARRRRRSSASCSPPCPSLKVARDEPRAAARPRRARVRRCRRSTCPASGAGAADSAAVQLFVERAQEAKPSFELTDDNLEAVAEICRRLEGIPLAIELAAARVKLMTPEQIVGRLGEKRLSFLTGGGGGQDSLRDAIEWSYNLLDDLGKALFARLGVFVGGSSLETAETVAGEPLGLEFGEVLDGVAALVDNGLVRQGEGADGEPRFRMLETIREYALERLAERGELDDARTRHLERYVAARRDGRAGAHAQRPGRRGSSGSREENDNIRAALAWSFESGQVELGLRLAGALVRFWSIRGLMTEGRRWLTEALGARRGRRARPCSRKALLRGRLRGARPGRLPAGEAVFEQSLELAREAGDVAARGAGAPADRLARDDARQATRTTHGERARELAGRALELARVDRRQARRSRARSTSSPSSRPRRATTRRRTSSTSRASTLRRELGDKRLIANSVLTLGRAELTRGDYEQRDRAPRRRASRSRASSATRGACRSRSTNLGRVALRDGGDTAEAAKLFADALKLAKERGDKRVAAECLQGLGAVVATRRRRARRRRGCSAPCDALLESIGATPTTIEVALNEQFIPSVKTSLGEERFSDRVGRGPRRAARGGDRGRALRRRQRPRARRRVAAAAPQDSLSRRPLDSAPMAATDEAHAREALVRRAPQHAAAAAADPRRSSRRSCADRRRALLHRRDHVAARDRRLLGRRARVHDRALLGPPLAPPGRGAPGRGRPAPRRGAPPAGAGAPRRRGQAALRRARARARRG